MTADSSPPPMRYSAVYLDRKGTLRSYHTSYQHPPMSSIPHPQSAYVNPSSRNPAVINGPDPNRTQSSVCSGESASTAGSTAASENMHSPQNKQYQYSPPTERSFLEEPLDRRSHRGSHSASAIQRNMHGQSEMTEDRATIFQYIQQNRVEEEVEDDHALWILVWMSFLDPFHCLFSAFYSILAAFTILILLPLRLCQRECSPGISLIRMLAPVFRNHLQMIYAKSLVNVHKFEFSPIILLLVNIVSPIISLGNAIAAWIVAVFWLFAIMMGNPDGTERGDDGRATVLMLRDWWERCLLSAVRK